MRRTSARRSLAAVVTAVATLGAFSLVGGALAQEFPSRAIRVIVPFAPGSAADTTTRFLGVRLADRIKQPVVVENRPGASAVIGANALRQATPDGYTIGNLASALVAQPFLVKNFPFDIRKDFAPISLMYSGPMVLTVAQSFPARSMAELVALARANPGKLFVGSIGNGSATHLAAELLKQMTGTAISNVPFKDSLEMHRAVAGGDVSFSFDSYASPKGLIEAGRLRAIAVTSRERLASLPAIPAIAESVAGFELESWTGLATPTGVPAEAHARLTSELRAIMQSAEWKQLMTNNGVEAGGGTPEDFSRRIAADFEKFGRVLQAAGLKPES